MSVGSGTGRRARARADGNIFSRRALFWVVGASAVFFFGSLAILFGSKPEVDGARAGGVPLARSALGHRAFVETLRRLDIPVVVSRYDSMRKAGRRHLLFVGEPIRRTARVRLQLKRLLSAPQLILVLPKRRGRPDRERPNWVGRSGLVLSGQAGTILREAVPNGRVVRARGFPQWRTNRFRVNPTIRDPQLMTGAQMRPIVTSDKGMLVGEIRRGRSWIWIVSDPDIFANHGIGDGRNATLAVGIVQEMLPRNGAVIVDATVHGLGVQQSIWHNLFNPPFLGATIAGVIALLVAIWAGFFRFGSPRRARAPFEAGKTTLIENATRLLRYGDHQRDVLRRYHKAVLSSAARQLRAPSGTAAEDRLGWLDRIGAARGASESIAELSREIDALVAESNTPARRLVDAAWRLNRWKQEVLDGA